MNAWKHKHTLYNLKFVIIVSSLVIPLSCSTVSLDKSIVFRESPPAVIGELIPIRLGVNVFEDIRTEKEKRKMSKLDDIGENLAINFSNSLEYCNVFSDVKIPYKPDDVDVILKGKIENFRWEEHTGTMRFVSLLITSLTMPLLYSQYLIWGGEMVNVSAQVGIEVYLENARTQQTIARYFETKEFYESVDMYNVRSFDFKGLKLNDLLRELSEKIIEQIFADRDKIIESVKPKV